MLGMTKICFDSVETRLRKKCAVFIKLYGELIIRKG